MKKILIRQNHNNHNFTVDFILMLQCIQILTYIILAKCKIFDFSLDSCFITVLFGLCVSDKFKYV